MSGAMVSRLTGISECCLRKLKATAFERGFDPKVDARIYERYVEDSPCPGRQKIITAEQEKQVIDSVTADCIGCEKSAEVLGFEAGISIISILRILKDNGFTSKKPTCKPGLTDAAKQ